MNLEDLKIYLPKFLSSDSEKELFKGLKDFPENIDDRIYTSYLKDSSIIFQGDGMNNFLVINLPDSEIKKSPVMILSNTCDIDAGNLRNFPSQIVYAPIFNLKKYHETLKKNSQKTEEQISAHIKAIKNQNITQIFFLPKYGLQLEDSIVFLDRLNNIQNSQIVKNEIANDKIFTLSNYGYYLFLFKLSIHFTRIQDNIDRSKRI